MSEETENITPPETPAETPATPTPAKKPVPKKAPFNAFIGKNNHYSSPKSGNPGNKGRSFKGGGMKKGK